MKLSKGETNELLLKISEDNHLYGCIFKLIYVYAKDGKTVITLRWNDVEFDRNIIHFKGNEFPLLPSLVDDLMKLDNHGEYVFLDDSVVDSDFDGYIDIFRKRLKYYLVHCVKVLDVSYRVSRNSLSITDLRRLRGQHLLCDGVPLRIVMGLYLQSKGTISQFKKFLEYDTLYESKYPCDSLGSLFKDYTDLSIFDFDDYCSNRDYFVVSNRSDNSIVVYIDDGDLGVIDDEDIGVNNLLWSEVNRLYDNGSLDSLGVLKDYEFKSCEGLSFVRM